MPATPDPTAGATPTAEPLPVNENPPPVVILNPGFEEQDADGQIPGWESNGPAEAVLLEGNGHSGEFRLTHKSAAAYQIETRQTVTGLDNQWYTLRAWIRSSGGQNDAWLGLTCGGEEQRVHLPSTSPGYRWLNLVVSNEVVGAGDGACTISLFSDGNPDTWASFDDIELVPGRAALTILGADISSLAKSEDLGGVYRETDGTPGDALQIMKDHGLNYARLRVWVDPADGYNSKATVLAMAQRLAAKDIKLLVDFHYSDNWADPGKQIKPVAWADLDFEGLKAAVYDHTFDVCSALVAQGTPPAMVQVGNEINAGLLWPDADYQNFDNMAELLTAGYQAVKECSPDTLVMLHIAEGGDNELAKWWFGNITRRDVPFDLIGISYYPFWHGSLGELQFNLNDISERYGKDVVVVETAYAFTEQDEDDYPNIAESSLATPGYPFTPQGQRAMLRDVMAVVRAVPNGRGLGVFFWDATWTAVAGNGWDGSDPTTGNAWENQALFDYDDIVLPALDEYLHP
ncbi:MAG: arabinogalactan endo-1,4-beta-galactosidase [Candidatus Promineofilum sp.]|jgi:arabinogalactan endo-1,4-beta-galactosidase|nr:arabinogalactan endo-1,4-beta-galactosidase [Promineifilum sp.]